jgi:hypothetical protein
MVDLLPGDCSGEPNRYGPLAPGVSRREGKTDLLSGGFCRISIAPGQDPASPRGLAFPQAGRCGKAHGTQVPWSALGFGEFLAIGGRALATGAPAVYGLTPIAQPFFRFPGHCPGRLRCGMCRKIIAEIII